jgi:hypothetical protein
VGRSSSRAILTKIYIKSRFKAIGIWLFNPKTMDIKIQPSQIYITKLIKDQGSENNTRNDEVDQNQYWGKKCAVVKLLHIYR